MLAGGLLKVGDDLLSHFRSTIGAARFNFSVRNGKRWSPRAIVALFLCLSFSALPSGRRCGPDRDLTGSALEGAAHSAFLCCRIRFRLSFSLLESLSFGVSPEKGFGRLVPLGCHRCRCCTCGLSTQSSSATLVRRSYLGEGFALRCFQRLSLPDAATRPCPWRDNRLTGGLSNTVLSY